MAKTSMIDKEHKRRVLAAKGKFRQCVYTIVVEFAGALAATIAISAYADAV